MITNSKYILTELSGTHRMTDKRQWVCESIVSARKIANELDLRNFRIEKATKKALNNVKN